MCTCTQIYAQARPPRRTCTRVRMRTPARAESRVSLAWAAGICVGLAEGMPRGVFLFPSSFNTDPFPFLPN